VRDFFLFTFEPNKNKSSIKMADTVYVGVVFLAALLVVIFVSEFFRRRNNKKKYKQKF